MWKLKVLKSCRIICWHLKILFCQVLLQNNTLTQSWYREWQFSLDRRAVTKQGQAAWWKREGMLDSGNRSSHFSERNLKAHRERASSPNLHVISGRGRTNNTFMLPSFPKYCPKKRKLENSGWTPVAWDIPPPSILDSGSNSATCGPGGF